MLCVTGFVHPALGCQGASAWGRSGGKGKGTQVAKLTPRSLMPGPRCPGTLITPRAMFF